MSVQHTSSYGVSTGTWTLCFPPGIPHTSMYKGLQVWTQADTDANGYASCPIPDHVRAEIGAKIWFEFLEETCVSLIYIYMIIQRSYLDRWIENHPIRIRPHEGYAKYSGLMTINEMRSGFGSRIQRAYDRIHNEVPYEPIGLDMTISYSKTYESPSLSWSNPMGWYDMET